MYCRKCGKENKVGDLYCSKCGSKLSETPAKDKMEEGINRMALLPKIIVNIKRKQNVIIGIIIAIVVSVFGVTTFLSDGNKSKTGNTNANIINESKAILYNNEIYFTQYNLELSKNSLYKMKKDGTQVSQVIEKVGSCINIIDGWIYYIDSYGDRKYIEKMKLDGAGKTELVSDTAKKGNLYSNVYVDGDWIYYSKLIMDEDKKETSGIWRMKLDGSENTKLASAFSNTISSGNKRSSLGQFSCLNVTDKYIYYIRFYSDFSNNLNVKSFNYSICRSDLDGKNERVLLDQSNNNVKISDVNVYNNWIYYTLSKYRDGGIYTDDEIHRMELDGSDDSKLADGSNFNFSDDGWIFYRGKNSSFYKMKLDGSQSTRVLGENQCQCYDLNIVDKWIFYMTGDGTTVKMKFDGTNQNPA